MKRLKFLPFMAMALAAVSCGSQPGANLSSGISLDNLDTTVAPGTDFYRYACGGWIDSHPLPDQYARYGSFDLLAENNVNQINGIIREIAANPSEDPIRGKIATLYNMAMDSVKLNADGIAPLKVYFDAIDAVTSNSEIPVLAATLIRDGFAPYFGIYVGIDEMNSSMYLTSISQSGITLGNRDYYVSDDAANAAIRDKYSSHIARMFTLAGEDAKTSQASSRAVMKIETEIAQAHYDNLTLRDPYANYHKMSYADFKAAYPQTDWDAVMGVFGLSGIDSLNLSQPEPFAKAVTLMTQGNLDEQKTYLKWKVLKGAASMLSDDFVAEDFDFDGKTLSGLKEMKPRWKRAVAAVDGALGEAVGQMYVEKYFPAEAKHRMITLVDNLKKALGERIDALEWMSEQTKAKAQQKLSTFYVKVGYPDKWRDYSSLEIAEDSYFANMIRSTRFEYDYMFAKAGKPVDKTEWMMTPQTVNAYYNPTTNEICFPAGILQYPFFDMNADDAFNYGAIGVVIGHEMTHGFDDQGRLYDKDGNLSDWWTEQDAENFKERSQVLVDWFNAIEVLPGLHADGELTLGENIADYGGLQVAYQAFRNATAANPLGDVDGFTPQQRFYLAYANLWAGNIRDEQIRMLTQMDVHSLGKWRVNATLPHIGGWYEAFGITENDPMYLAPEDRAVIW